jgi:hypothetical protein
MFITDRPVNYRGRWLCLNASEMIYDDGAESNMLLGMEQPFVRRALAGFPVSPAACSRVHNGLECSRSSRSASSQSDPIWGDAGSIEVIA